MALALFGFSHSLTTNRGPRGTPSLLNNRAWMYFTSTLGSEVVGRGLLKTTTTRPYWSIAPSTSVDPVLSIGSLSSCTGRDQRNVPSALITVTHGVLGVPPEFTFT